MTNTALFVSPHLDDVVFSCGGTLADLAERGWRTCMATVFTATVLPVEGFALACQLDKGLGPDIDYMALRRAEDRDAADILGVHDLRWLGLPEAPHRGYGSASELFGPIRDDDAIWHTVALDLAALIEELRPGQIFAPQGLGDHVDHRHVITAVQHCAGDTPVAWYRDTPYAIRNPAARAHVDLDPETAWPIAHTLGRKIRAACAYQTQINFQFGSPDRVEDALTSFAGSEAGERFSGNLKNVLIQP